MFYQLTKSFTIKLQQKSCLYMKLLKILNKLADYRFDFCPSFLDLYFKSLL